MEKQKSFSLIEVIVAITVIMVGLIGVLGLIVYNVSISRTRPEKVVAANLAQEGIEAVRNQRDSNWLSSNPYDKDIIGPSGPGGFYYIIEMTDPSSDFKFQHITPAGNINDDSYNIYYNTTNKFYLQDHTGKPAGCNDTIFNRMIHITNTSDTTGDYLKVVSQVVWTDRTGSHSISLGDTLYDYELPEDNSPIRYMWQELYGGCYSKGGYPAGGNPIECFTDPYGDGIDWSERAPCDTNDNDVTCNKLSSQAAFGGDPDWLYDRFVYFSVCTPFHSPYPPCAVEANGCCNVFKKVPL